MDSKAQIYCYLLNNVTGVQSKVHAGTRHSIHYRGPARFQSGSSIVDSGTNPNKRRGSHHLYWGLGHASKNGLLPDEYCEMNLLIII